MLLQLCHLKRSGSREKNIEYRISDIEYRNRSEALEEDNLC
jgi:hypothetical protein